MQKNEPYMKKIHKRIINEIDIYHRVSLYALYFTFNIPIQELEENLEYLTNCNFLTLSEENGKKFYSLSNYFNEILEQNSDLLTIKTDLYSKIDEKFKGDKVAVSEPYIPKKNWNSKKS